jgi:hypothetical protein
MTVAMVLEAKRPVGRMCADSRRGGGRGAEAETTVAGGWAETYGFAVQ